MPWHTHRPVTLLAGAADIVKMLEMLEARLAGRRRNGSLGALIS